MSLIWIVNILSVFFLCVFFAGIVIPQILLIAFRRRLFDEPDERKIHQCVVPRLGGMAFKPVVFFSFVLLLAVNVSTGHDELLKEIGAEALPLAYAFCAIIMLYLVGIADDLIGVRYRAKFFIQIVCGIMLVAGGVELSDLHGMLFIHSMPSWISIPLTVFVTVFIINAINLIDGIDGLSGGLALLSLTGFLLCFIHEGIYTYAILIAGLMGVLTAYLYFNIWGKAEKGHKIFMGDSGSLTLGFILGFLLIKFAMHNPNVMPYRNNSLLITYTLLIVPCFDVVRVIITRLKNHYPIFKADKNHIHHKLMRAGMTQHQALVTILLLAVAFVVINTAMRPELRSDLVVLIDIIVYTAFQLVTDVFVRRREHGMQHEADCISK